MALIGEWILRVPLALLFVMFGFQKFPSGPGAPWVSIFENIGLGPWFRFFAGWLELGGGLLLLVPPATFVAVPLLVCTMIGAALVHVLVVGTGPQTIAVSVFALAILAIGVCYRRRTS